VRRYEQTQTANARASGESVEEFGIRAADLLPQRLEAEPAGKRKAGLLLRVGGRVVWDQQRGASGHRQELRLAAAVHAQEPERGFVDRLADREETVILMDGGLALREVSR